jgi:hypothetical protein
MFFFAGLQAVANPFDGYTRLLPFWSSRELGTWAIDGPDAGSLSRGLTHAVVVLVICAGATVPSELGELDVCSPPESSSPADAG